MVIMIENKVDVSKLCARGFRFGEAPKVIEKYGKVRSSSVYMICSGIGHN